MKNLEIHPIFDRTLQRYDREQLIGQKATMVWLSGLSGSGKSTVAIALEKELHNRGFLCRILDGDNIRSGINCNLTFSPEDRTENIRRIAEVAKLFVDTGIITIAAFISPTEEIRNMAKTIIGSNDFVDVHISTPISVCEQRDVKGLYQKARQGLIKDFTGVSQQFEKPEHPSLEIDTSKMSVEEAVEMLLEVILPRIEY